MPEDKRSDDVEKFLSEQKAFEDRKQALIDDLLRQRAEAIASIIRRSGAPCSATNALKIGLDVSQEETHLCVIDGEGKTVWQGKCKSTPDAIAAAIRDKAPRAVRIGLESGSLSTWHWHALNELGLPAICIDARHTQAAPGMQVNKTDKNDARGLAQIMRSGWYRTVRVKSLASHQLRATLRARAQLVGIHTDLSNQIRGILKTFGFVLPGVRGSDFEKKAGEAVDGVPGATLQAMLEVLSSIKRQLAKLDRQVLDYARKNRACKQLMTIPGVGPMTAAAFVTAVDDPGRFRKSKSVAAYLGLTPRRYQSGEVDHNGRISKCGDSLEGQAIS